MASRPNTCGKTCAPNVIYLLKAYYASGPIYLHLRIMGNFLSVKNPENMYKKGKEKKEKTKDRPICNLNGNFTWFYHRLEHVLHWTILQETKAQLL